MPASPQAIDAGLAAAPRLGAATYVSSMSSIGANLFDRLFTAPLAPKRKPPRKPRRSREEGCQVSLAALAALLVKGDTMLGNRVERTLPFRLHSGLHCSIVARGHCGRGLRRSARRRQ